MCGFGRKGAGGGGRGWKEGGGGNGGGTSVCIAAGAWCAWFGGFAVWWRCECWGSGGGGGVATGVYSGSLTPAQSNFTGITGTNAVTAAGASSAHNNAQPTFITNYIIKH